MDAFRHFRGARFREGETEDIFRADVRPKQQAKDAGGEHMGLSSASRSAEPDMILRVGGEALTALSWLKAGVGIHKPASTIESLTIVLLFAPATTIPFTPTHQPAK